MPQPQPLRSVPDVLRDIVGNLQEIVRSELRLAKTELKDESSKVAKASATLGVGLVLGFYGIGFLLLAAVYGLSSVMPVWMAALVVGSVPAIVGISLVCSGRSKLMHLNATPVKTIHSLEENMQWARQQIK